MGSKENYSLFEYGRNSKMKKSEIRPFSLRRATYYILYVPTAYCTAIAKVREAGFRVSDVPSSSRQLMAMEPTIIICPLESNNESIIRFYSRGPDGLLTGLSARRLEEINLINK